MINSPEQISQTPNPEDAKRLDFEQLKGWYKYGRIPYKIYYVLDYPTGTMVDEKTPGKYKVTPDSTGSESLSIFMHESVPAEFKDIIVFHELREAELVFADSMEIGEAHQQATTETKAYTKKHLDPEEF